MGQLRHHQSNRIAKLLNLGNSGAGKTGALACLAKAGYRLIIMDFDNGLDILPALLEDDREALDRVYFETFTDAIQMTNGMVVSKGQPKAFTSAMEALTRWKFPVSEGSNETYDLGNIGTWGPETVLVVDSLGFAAEAALRYTIQLNANQFDKFIHKEDYGQAMKRIEGFLTLLYSDAVKCNVVMNTHIEYSEDILSGSLMALPRALGAKLPPKVGGWFNSIVLTTATPTKNSTKRVIMCGSEIGFGLKLPVKPGSLPNSLPLETGLLTIFEALHKETNYKDDDDEPAQPASA